MGFQLIVAAAPDDLEQLDLGVASIVGVCAPDGAGESAFVVVSTQGAGDRAALKSAAAMEARYLAFVGSRRKAETLATNSPTRACRRPARREQGPGRGRHWAIAAEEIALSILTEMVAVRRRPQRATMEDAPR